MSACSSGPDGHCITCSDEGIPARVLALSQGDGLALCEDDKGDRHEVLVDLVGTVHPGDRLLIHAGVAIGAL